MKARDTRLSRDRNPAQITATIRAEAREASYAALTDSALNPREVQLMNLYQTKGREADATVRGHEKVPTGGHVVVPGGGR